MAAGDTISSSSQTNTYLYLTPASGDEWMIMQIGTSSTVTYLQMTPNGGSNWYTMYASPSYGGGYYSSLYTGVSQYLTTNNMMSRPDLHWHITNTVRIRAYSGGNYYNFWWAGIKTKD